MRPGRVVEHSIPFSVMVKNGVIPLLPSYDFMVWAEKITFCDLCLYRLIRPVVTYGCEIYVQKDRRKHKLTVCEREVRRKINDPIKNRDESWRIKTKEEKDLLIKHADVFRYIRAQRIRWIGHIVRKGKERTVKRMTE
jgi:hypothetical protein